MHNLSFAVIDLASPKFSLPVLKAKPYPPQFHPTYPLLAPNDEYGQVAFFFFFFGALFPISLRPGEGWHIKPQPSFLDGLIWGQESQAESPIVHEF